MLPLITSEQVKELGKRQLDFSNVSCLPKRIQESLGDPNTLRDPVKLDEVVKYMISHSEILKILNSNPASDAVLRIVYQDFNSHLITEGLDYYLSHSLSGQALRDRLVFCSNWIAERFILEGKRVIDLGAGSGSYAFESLRVKGHVPSNFVWECIDLDIEAIKFGEDHAKATNLGDKLIFRQGNFMSRKSIGDLSDFAVLIGVICGMDEPTAINCLERSKSHLKEGGEILAATLLDRSFEEDSLIFRILCNIGGWQLRPKSVAKVKEIFISAGYKILNIYSERPGGAGQYAVVHARRN